MQPLFGLEVPFHPRPSVVTMNMRLRNGRPVRRRRDAGSERIAKATGAFKLWVTRP